MRVEIDVVLDYDLPEPHDVLLQVEVAQMADQRIIGDKLTVSSPERLRPVEGNEAVGQRTWAAGVGQFHAHYSAIVAIDRAVISIHGLAAADPRDLPALVVPYLLPSRYCESDKFEAFVADEFGHVTGGNKIVAMRTRLDEMKRHLPDKVEVFVGDKHHVVVAADGAEQRRIVELALARIGARLEWFVGNNARTEFLCRCLERLGGQRIARLWTLQHQEIAPFA